MLSQAEISRFNEDGVIQVSEIFSDAELDNMENAFDEIVLGRLRVKKKIDLTWEGDWKDKFQMETQLLGIHDPQAYSDVWARVLFHEKLTECFSDLIGSNVQLHHTKLFQKPPEKGSGFPTHQDYPYFPHSKHTMMAAIIHLVDTTEDMGCVRAYPGTHKIGVLETVSKGAFYVDQEKYPIEEATPFPAKRGDVVMFNYLTLHGSGMNLSQKTRKTVLFQVRDPEDLPIKIMHSDSHAQGLMLKGVNPNGDWRT